MATLKIAISAIAKNESMHVDRFCNAAKDADLISVCDTGSIDNTVDLLLKHGVTVHRIHVDPWRFDDARNAALALLPPDIDVVASVDLDEVLQPGWRQEIERVWGEGTTRLRYGFDWGAGIVFKYEKIFARKGYRFFGPCHEYPVPDRIVECYADTDRLLLVHQPDSSKSRSQYLDLLRVSIEENPDEPRNAFYYARELSFVGEWQASIEQCQRYLGLKRANWPNERAYALRVMGKCYQELGQWSEALAALRRATAESPDTREPWHDLALCCYRVNRWAECLGAALTCLDIKHKQLLYTVDPAVWGAAPHDLAALGAWNLGLRELAQHHASEAVRLSPEDARLVKNLAFMTEKAA